MCMYIMLGTFQYKRYKRTDRFSIFCALCKGLNNHLLIESARSTETIMAQSVATTNNFFILFLFFFIIHSNCNVFNYSDAREIKKRSGF